MHEKYLFSPNNNFHQYLAQYYHGYWLSWPVKYIIIFVTRVKNIIAFSIVYVDALAVLLHLPVCASGLLGPDGGCCVRWTPPSTSHLLWLRRLSAAGQSAAYLRHHSANEIRFAYVRQQGRLTGARRIGYAEVQGAVLLTVGRSYVGNDVTHSTLLDSTCASSYENLPKYRSYRVSNTAPWSAGGRECGRALFDKDKSSTRNPVWFSQPNNGFDLKFRIYLEYCHFRKELNFRHVFSKSINRSIDQSIN